MTHYRSMWPSYDLTLASPGQSCCITSPSQHGGKITALNKNCENPGNVTWLYSVAFFVDLYSSETLFTISWRVGSNLFFSRSDWSKTCSLILASLWSGVPLGLRSRILFPTQYIYCLVCIKVQCRIHWLIMFIYLLSGKSLRLFWTIKMSHGVVQVRKLAHVIFLVCLQIRSRHFEAVAAYGELRAYL